MPTTDVPATEWQEFLESFARRHRAWLARVDQGRAGRINRTQEARPLAAITPQRDGRRVASIEISFSGDSGSNLVRVDNPAAIRVRQTNEGADRELEIVDRDGVCTRVGFRAAARPEVLDGLAPGEEQDVVKR